MSEKIANRKDSVVAAQVYAAERERIEAAAAKEGRTVSNWVRVQLLKVLEAQGRVEAA